MKGRVDIPNSTVRSALEAITNLWQKEFSDFLFNAQMVALSVHSRIDVVPAPQKSATFYREFLPLRENLVALLGNNYRRYFKVGLAQPLVAGEPHDWAWLQLQSAVYASIDWICDWYVLACSGENRFIRPIASASVDPGTTVSLTIPLTGPPVRSATSWRAPAWLFSVLPDLTGIGLMKEKNMPAVDSEQELGAAHTCLIVKGARRAFLWRLAEIIEIVRNEETAAAATIPANLGEQPRPNRKKTARHLRGLEGLGQKKSDLSRYIHGLTDKQTLAFSLRYEYRLGLAEIADRMGIDRKTVHEHLAAANKRLERVLSNEQYKSHKAKSVRE